ncbi:MAG: flagellar hook-length control protein FliK, partial [Planctomycetota bacterium]
ARTRDVKPSDTKGEVATVQLDEAVHVAEKTTQRDEPVQASTKQRPSGNREDVAVDQATNEATDAATKLAAPDIVEAVVDNAGEESSRQRHTRPDKDGPQPIGSANAADAPPTTAGTPSRFAQHLLGKAETASSRGPSISDADQARFVDRVARAVQATGDRGGTLRLRLSPPELGALTLEVKVQGGAVTARVEADTPAARSLLLENLPLLRERLAEHGMRVDQFDVDLSDRHPGGFSDGLQQHDRQHEDRPRSKAAALKRDDMSPVISSDTPTKNDTEQLNVIV